MTDQNSPSGNLPKASNGNGQESRDVARGQPVMVHSQYARDISFENPNAPASLGAGQKQPEMDVSITMDATKLENESIEDFYEVVLKLRATATRDRQTMFIAEIEYAAAVSVGGIPEEQRHPFLMIEIPRHLFPFVRQILCDLTHQGGYPPLVLNPVDFHAMYLEQFGGGDSAKSAIQ